MRQHRLLDIERMVGSPSGIERLSMLSCAKWQGLTGAVLLHAGQASCQNPLDKLDCAQYNLKKSKYIT